MFFICIFFLTIFSRTSAQYYNTGQDPGSLRWMQIKTGRFTVIYPRNYGNAGIDFARSLDSAYSKLTYLYPGKKFRIPVIIHNYTTESNGYVAWAPSRMEIYPTPEQNSIPLDPNTQLAVHELTHAFQMTSLNSGFTKAMSYIAGQQFTGIVSSLVPTWLLEGDAVFSESVLTNSGRGRVPSFQKQLKALVLEKGHIFKYDKIVNGSFRDFVPDHYQTGYQIMAWSYSKYGRQLWENALNYVSGAPFTLNPVNLSLYHSANLTKKKIFQEAFDSLKTIWEADYERSGSEEYEVLNPSKGKDYFNYFSPLQVGADSIISLKTSLSDPPVFVLVRPSTKKEEKIFTPGYLYPRFFSYGKGKLLWVEMHTDPRWENRTWSVIKILDLKRKTIQKLSSKTRYMSASISYDGRLVAATENTIDNRNNLILLDAGKGNILETIPAPENASLQRPQWNRDGKLLSVISLTKRGEGIMSYNVNDKTWNILVSPGPDDIQSTYMRNDSLFYISSFSGTDNVYVQKSDKSVIPLTRSRFGISDLSLDGNKLLFSDYTSQGNNICFTTLSPGAADKKAIKTESSYLINRFKSEPGISTDVSDKIYDPEPYRKWQHLFRFHSWMPFYTDIEVLKNDPTYIKPGLTLMTQNNLSTLISTIGYEYSDKRHKLHSSIKWLGWYLEFETRLDFGNPPYIEKFHESVNDPLDITNGYELTNTVSLPLLFQGGTFSKYLFFSASSRFRNDYIYLKETKVYDFGQNEFTGRFYFSNLHRSAIRDIYPKWAQVIDISYSYYPFDKDIYGDIFTARTAFYFPGFLKDNGFKIRLEAEKQNPAKFILGNRASFSRGYENIISKEIRFGSVDYYMPLAYPDFNISSIFYMTRIRSQIFYDLTRGTGNFVFGTGVNGPVREFHNYSETFRSFGIQLMTDFYVFRIPFMISSGIEAAWKNLNEYPVLKILFNVDLFGMNIGSRRF